jgi:anthraniloyl-CoA monooxygenase
LTEAAKIGYKAIAWPRPYESGKPQLEAGFARDKQLAASAATAVKEQ